MFDFVHDENLYVCVKNGQSLVLFYHLQRLKYCLDLYFLEGYSKVELGK